MKRNFVVTFNACLIWHACILEVQARKSSATSDVFGHAVQDASRQTGVKQETLWNMDLDAHEAVPAKKSTVSTHINEEYNELPSLTSIINVDRYGNWTKWSTCAIYGCVQFRHRECLDDSWKKRKLNPIGNSDCTSKYQVVTRECKKPTLCSAPGTLGNCGVRPNPLGNMNKIVGGESSKPNAWPWKVRLSIRLDASDATTLCGGTLIAPQWILTAAHCVTADGKTTLIKEIKGADSVVAHVGDHRISEREVSQKDYLVRIVIVHPDFIRKLPSDGYDIALLYLADPIGMQSEFNLACLPTESFAMNTNTSCYAVGWGVKYSRSDESILQYIIRLFRRWSTYDSTQPAHSLHNRIVEPDELQEVNIPIQDSAKCSVHYEGIRESFHICAGTKGKGGCVGDSGGGLYCQPLNSDKWVVTGVASFGSRNRCDSQPGVFNSVIVHLDWIHQTMAQFEVPFRVKYGQSSVPTAG